MRLRVGAAAACLLSGVCTVPAGAAAERRLVVTGAGIAFGDVLVREATTLSWDNFSGDHRAITATYSGDYAGFVVQSANARSLLGGGILVRGRTVRIGGGWADPVTLVDDAATSLRLAPGRYRVVLISDGPAAVRVRVTKGRSLTVRASRRAAGITATRLDLDDLVPVGPVAVGNTRVPFTLTARGLVAGSFFSSPGDTAPAYVALCVRGRADPVEQPCDEGWFIYPGSAITTSSESREVTSSRPAGDYYFDYTETIAGPVVAAGNAFVVTFADAT